MSVGVRETPRVSPHGNYGHWALMACPCRFISCDKCFMLVKDVIMGEAMLVWGQEL